MGANKQELDDYYSLIELIEKIGKDGVADLVAKGKPKRLMKGNQIYFLKVDVNRILGNSFTGQDYDDVIIDNDIASKNILKKVCFLETFIKRHDLTYEEEIYRDNKLDLSKEICYGRGAGDIRQQEEFQNTRIISSLHGKLYLDEDNNLLYENISPNKTKVRGCQDKSYILVHPQEISVLFPSDILVNIEQYPKGLSSSIKLGYQQKPHYIIRIQAKHNDNSF
ncbi:MAG: hypothetical protein KBC30_10495 [Planctomycetes bacterium]|nr:hypothetical protein [Planctomycetota bacterium]HPY75358.1 hypothetical protein [Planctomycetota bacterium]HQB00971.1 hypothetical protein [Planctomycetota bacterium]HRU51144.1 hypothetical protein [Planctomycetota bacterium]